MALVVALPITSWQWWQWVRCWGVDGIVGGDVVLTLVASGAAVRVQVVATGEAVRWRAELRGEPSAPSPWEPGHSHGAGGEPDHSSQRQMPPRAEKTEWESRARPGSLWRLGGPLGGERAGLAVAGGQVWDQLESGDGGRLGRCFLSGSVSTPAEGVRASRQWPPSRQGWVTGWAELAGGVPREVLSEVTGSGRVPRVQASELGGVSGWSGVSRTPALPGQITFLQGWGGPGPTLS